MPSGKTCRVPATRGRQFCYHHDPDTRERRPLRSFASGIEPLDSLSSLHRLIEDAVRQLLQGNIDTRRARAIMTAAREAIYTSAFSLQGLHILCSAAFDRINRTADHVPRPKTEASGPQAAPQTGSQE